MRYQMCLNHAAVPHGSRRSESLRELFIYRSIPAGSCEKSLIRNCDIRQGLFSLIMETSDDRK